MAESMHADPDIAKRIWAGDTTVLSHVYERYLADQEGQFVPYMSSLYSFRDRPLVRAELISYADELLRWSDPGELLARSASEHQAADRADVISTILLWLPTHGARHGDVSQIILNLVEAGIRWAPRESHTCSLLALTGASLFMDPREERFANHVTQALVMLNAVGENVAHIVDANQRARVYRKLAALYLQAVRLGEWMALPRAVRYALQALTVRGIPWDVRRKTVAAMIGR